MKKIIILGTAHLDSTPGKCSPNGKFREAVYSRNICADVKTLLEQSGYTVLYDYEPLSPMPEWTAARKRLGYQKGEQAMELAHRVKVVNNICRQYGAANCLYVSIHVNAAGSDGKWHGAGGWCAITSVGQTNADSLAECFYDAAFTHLRPYIDYLYEGKRKGEYTSAQTPFRMDRSDGDRDLEQNLYVLRHTACPAVLTENLFQDNILDVAYLTSDAGRQAIIRLHVEGILQYCQNH